jgi:hypothetical protein
MIVSLSDRGIATAAAATRYFVSSLQTDQRKTKEYPVLAKYKPIDRIVKSLRILSDPKIEFTQLPRQKKLRDRTCWEQSNQKI